MCQNANFCTGAEVTFCILGPLDRCSV